MPTFNDILNDPKYRNVSPAVKELIREALGFTVGFLEEYSEIQTRDIIKETCAEPTQLAESAVFHEAVLSVLAKAGCTQKSEKDTGSTQKEEKKCLRDEHHSTKEIQFIISKNIKRIEAEPMFRSAPFRLLLLSQYIKAFAVLRPGDTVERWNKQVYNAVTRWEKDLCPFAPYASTKGYYTLRKK